ncbi:MAG TPA: tyrosine-type recombinase/integrase [Terracidiphilus sp.]|jgi:integrase
MNQKSSLREDPQSVSAVLTANIASLAAIVGEAQTRGLVATNNVRAVTKTKRKRAEGHGQMEMPTMDELRAILVATPARHRPIILTALLAGLRASELRGLLWSDVDLKASEIKVSPTGRSIQQVRTSKVGSRYPYHSDEHSSAQHPKRVAVGLSQR